MNEDEMEVLLGYYATGIVPRFENIRRSCDLNEPAFDGSFGWW